MTPHPAHNLYISLMVTKLASEGCESCCQREAGYIVYESFVCQSCMEAS